MNEDDTAEEDDVEENSLLIISENVNGFLVGNIKEALEQADVITYSIAMNDPELFMQANTVKMYMLVIGADSELAPGMRDVVSLLVDKCYEHNKKLVLYGNQVQVNEVKRMLPEGLLADVLLRPIDNQEVVNRVLLSFKKLEVYRNKKKVLVVDDSGPMLRTIMGWLEGKYHVTLANSAATAVKAMDKEMPDLILLDYEMPVCSGAHFMSLLKTQEKTRDIPVIFLTSRDDKETIKEVFALKPAGYLLKTTPEEKVIKAIDDFFVNQKSV